MSGTIASLEDRRSAQCEARIAELELDIAMHMATVAMIHVGWKEPEFRARCERMTYSEIYAHTAKVLRSMKATSADGTPAPTTKVLEAIGTLVHDDADQPAPALEP